MRILVVGSGGREHALAWKLSQEAEVHVAPGNPGIAEDAKLHPVAASDFPALISLAKQLSVDLVVVGPENPLIEGLADALRAEGIPTFGPSAADSRLEGSKAFSKALMREARIPTAEFQTFTESGTAREYARDMFQKGRPVVIKASGAALGKGVIVCSDVEDAERAISSMIDDNEFGGAGSTIVVEERLRGPEFSLLTLCSGERHLSLPVAQDYKRAYEKDEGPNTGGMGSYSPVPWISTDLIARTEAEVVAPVLRSLKGSQYRGLLFSGLMVQDGKPYCLEYNVRFGDPETQSVMMRLGNGFAAALLACAKGEQIPEVEVLLNHSVCVVVASAHYPGDVTKGIPIDLPATLPPNAKIFHAGTALRDGQLVTNGGRVFGVTASGETAEEAREAAYALAKKIEFDGAWYRSDIALQPAGIRA